MNKDEFTRATDILNDYIQSRPLKYSEKRLVILRALLDSNRHLTAEELYSIVKDKDASIGIATIYRTLRLFTECGISGELTLDGSTTRYYPALGKAHHDHLICIKCGKVVNIVSPGIEKTQEKLARENGFTLESHRLDLFGICSDCQK